MLRRYWEFAMEDYLDIPSFDDLAEAVDLDLLANELDALEGLPE